MERWRGGGGGGCGGSSAGKEMEYIMVNDPNYRLSSTIEFDQLPDIQYLLIVAGQYKEQVAT